MRSHKAGLGDAKLHGDGLSVPWCCLLCSPVSTGVCRCPIGWESHCPGRVVPAPGGTRRGVGGGRGTGLGWASPGLPASGGPSWGAIPAPPQPRNPA
jgi:hypothetical protein